jgi:hypothetical protein
MLNILKDLIKYTAGSPASEGVDVNRREFFRSTMAQAADTLREVVKDVSVGSSRRAITQAWRWARR